MALLKKGKGPLNVHITATGSQDGQECRVIIEDITERKQAEAALRAAEETARQRLRVIEDLYRDAPVGLCVLDRDLRYVRINERLAEINGIPAEAHIGKRVHDLMPELAERVAPEMRRVLETGQPRLNIEIVSETPAQRGVKRSWLEQWLPLSDADGRVLYRDRPNLVFQIGDVRSLERTPEALRRLLLREARVQPVLLVVEDLHWIDVETQALLDHLVEGLAAAPFLLVVNYRPEYRHDWGNRSYYTQLRLDPLPVEDATEFLEALVGTDQGLAPLKRLLIDRTEGNPFFLEESVRTMVETDVLVGERGAYRLARQGHIVQVPASVQAVLAARIDRLEPGDKALLQTAAVIGKDIPLPLLRTTAGEPEDTLLTRLARLQAAEFLYETSTSSSCYC